MGRNYTGWDKNASSKRKGLEKLVDLLEEHYGLWNNGTLAVRSMRGKSNPSVHGTGRAADLSWRGGNHKGPGNYEAACKMIDFVVGNADQLGIEAVFDYYPKPWGRGWKCDRADWTVYKQKTISGAPGGDWVHIEVSNEWADDPGHYETFFASIFGGKKPEVKQEVKAPAYPGKSLRKGAKGDNVKLVQAVVSAKQDGDFGPRTEFAVKAWQRKNKACCGPMDGVVGPRTWKCMFNR